MFYLLPVEQIEPAIQEEIVRFVVRIFRCETAVLAPMDMPEEAFDPDRKQYNATLIMRDIIGRCPADTVRLLGVTEKDIFIPMLTYIFGQAQVEGPVAFLSLARLRQEFYGLPAYHDLLLSRILKETLHELGHTFGLVHCLDPECAMSLSINVGDIDNKMIELCGSCHVRLQDKLDDLGCSK
ncbi:MAG: archaemetzincin family Zn-dependent metalloprotease [Candidatus Eisenbacteria bacterium]|uniref:Archaemetzincin family Zn-dependent metalloprotease n=1 Tax=Eiseniibacteriota bacterium TaxID=2212470 RepID=A0A948W5Q4_UNCEI|nr:archaemetzincin family Zn-dependent metalloprotease [Candidatus Eisenbacteria bacterium]MBU1949486.1 archaemetzincin family Zn-dependent metalloprotease [Candidatus Eisenbacteria bacterium]MBU2690669.1 archaemetzincin family Zn-dependent metalloprotease [Candidatus Eisenbacteria bacterium]